MKPSLIVLAGSLVLNALLLVAIVRGARTHAAATTRASQRGPPVLAPAPTRAAPPTAATLLALDPAALRTELQRREFPTEAIDALVIARIYARHDARRRELAIETNRRPWWETVTAGPSRMSLLTAEQRKELRHLDAAARSEVLRLLGPEALDRDGAIAARYAFVPATSAVHLDALVRDYQDINAMVREEMHGLRTAVDREHEAFVEAERQRDLARLLTPEEREIFELRTSPVTDDLRHRFGTFEPSEAEYRALFAIYRDFHAQHPGSVSVEGQPQRARFVEYPDYEYKIRDLLGPARYADWKLSGQGFSRTLAVLAPEFGLPAAAVKGAAILLRDTAARSWAIGEDASLAADQQHAALAALVADTRLALANTLGAPASAALLRQVSWLERIAQGQAVRIDGSAVSWTAVEDVRNTAPRPSR